MKAHFVSKPCEISTRSSLLLGQLGAILLFFGFFWFTTKWVNIKCVSLGLPWTPSIILLLGARAPIGPNKKKPGKPHSSRDQEGLFRQSKACQFACKPWTSKIQTSLPQPMLFEVEGCMLSFCRKLVSQLIRSRWFLGPTWHSIDLQISMQSSWCKGVIAPLSVAKCFCDSIPICSQ